MSRRFYLPPSEIRGELAFLRGREAHHAARVMRMKVGEAVTLFDGEGREYQGTIQEITKGEITVSVKTCVEEKKEEVSLEVAYSLPKHPQMERVIEKLTELRVQAILPMVSERTIPKVKGEIDKKILRFRQCATEAAKQCGVSRLPKIENIFSFSEVLGFSKNYDLALFLAPKGKPLKAILHNQRVKRVIVAVGPEGGWTDGEQKAADESGWQSVSLGRSVLKVETACLSIVSILDYALDV